MEDVKQNKNKRQGRRLLCSHIVLLTSEQGDKLSVKENMSFSQGVVSNNNIVVEPSVIKHEVQGIGTSFTESSAFVLAHLNQENRKEVMHKIFSEDGANFSLTRTHIGACDFCVEGKYSYDHVRDDLELKHFDISPDIDGFEKSKYPKIKDNKYDLLPMIQEALSIKKDQDDASLGIIASAWTAPPWMKDIDDWYQSGNSGNGHRGTGGVLNPQHEEVFADYLIKYLEAYKKAGVDIAAITPVNEPLGNNGQWESMHFTAESQNAFIRNYLGPKLKKGEFKDVELLIFDHARDQLEHWTDTIYSDKETSQYIDGAAIHWYESTFKVYEDVLDRVHKKYPDYSIIHTEGCIDDLGKDAPEGVLDPVGYKEKDWFDNDSFWWNENATDWGYSVTWEGVNADDHPMYTPVHRYARNIIVSLDNWVSGWIDWNIVLDKHGGPNHVGNFCGAPIMIDTDTEYVYYTPIFYILAQFSRTIRPGDRMVEVDLNLAGELNELIYSCASVNDENLLAVQLLNTSKQEEVINLQIEGQYASVEIDANSLKTIQIQL